MTRFVCFLLAGFYSLALNAQNVGIGTTTPNGRLHIKRNADTSQLVIDANATQGFVPLVKFRNAYGNDLLHLHSDTSFNLFMGYKAGSKNVLDNTGDGLHNSFLGYQAGSSNTTGKFNTAVGSQSLLLNESGFSNTVIGYAALYNNNGEYNSAFGLKKEIEALKQETRMKTYKISKSKI